MEVGPLIQIHCNCIHTAHHISSEWTATKNYSLVYQKGLYLNTTTTCKLACFTTGCFLRNVMILETISYIPYITPKFHTLFYESVLLMTEVHSTGNVNILLFTADLEAPFAYKSHWQSLKQSESMSVLLSKFITIPESKSAITSAVSASSITL